MRSSSTTWTITVHPPFPSVRSTPRTDSIGRPSNAGNSSRTCSIAFRAESRPLAPFWFLRRCSATDRLLRSPHRLRCGEPLEQLLLQALALLLVKLAVLSVELERKQLAADPVLVIQLPLGLVEHLLCDPHGAADRGQWEG